MEQMVLAETDPDIIVACAGGGSNFGGLSLIRLGQLAFLEGRFEDAVSHYATYRGRFPVFDYADCKHLYMNWNCDGTDVEEPGFEANFHSVKDRIRNIHLHDLTNEKYPYRRLFELLRKNGYAGYCDAEIKGSPEPLRLMRYSSARNPRASL